MGRGEEELPPDATMLMGDDVLQEEEMESFGWSLLNYMIIQIENIQTQETMVFFFMTKQFPQLDISSPK